jgi:hypothetical protein
LIVLAVLLCGAVLGCPNVTDGETTERGGGGFEAPSGLTAAIEGRSVTLTWKAVEGAEAYEFYYAQGSSDVSGAVYYEDISDPVYTMEGLGWGTPYYFWVRAKKAGGETSGFSVPVRAVIPVPAPDTGGIIVSKDTNALYVSWEPEEGASDYRVYFATTPSESAMMSYVSALGNNYKEIPGLQTETTYYIRIRSTWDGGVSGFSGLKSLKTGETVKPLKHPKLYGVAQLDGGRLDLYWDAVDNATFYKIYASTNEGNLGTVEPVMAYGTTYRLTGLEDGTPYYLGIEAWGGSKRADGNMTKTLNPATPGGRLPADLEGTFMSRYPDARRYYMDGHWIGPASELKDNFPYNVAGRPSPIGPSPGKYIASGEDYPVPGLLRPGSMDTGGGVMRSGYAINPGRDQFVFYDGGVMGIYLFGIVRVVVQAFERPNEWFVLCEYGNYDRAKDKKYFGMLFRESTPDVSVYGLMQGSMTNFSEWELSTGQIYTTAKNFYDAGVAYPALKIGYKDWLTVDPDGPLYNPLRIRPEPIWSIWPGLAELGIHAPENWWEVWNNAETIPQEVLAAFWNQVRW